MFAIVARQLLRITLPVSASALLLHRRRILVVRQRLAQHGTHQFQAIGLGEDQQGASLERTGEVLPYRYQVLALSPPGSARWPGGGQ
ncbi:hypothetical protein [Siccirubricoccus sp. G192]|uniref:hypothetical protein n=1 Tax=Siccirubricoccus sp. G192 TaxID=2849651 RepID=UPI0020C54EB8|nr:hypothetical protein [Siccirubricoccus sp. G192]